MGFLMADFCFSSTMIHTLFDIYFFCLKNCFVVGLKTDSRN
ncbi:hypothetical protein LEP1GSC082_1925 [Leptospira kirschneri str. H2]|uniref:Uncharacterized protein n=1 Tax=Leptospira kirschneri str. H1 TaxID=1049966 RepID=A0A0E2AYF5_9LEPT|nr:hypothetical protein LEP1GSC081_0273 [Leptospira kirschneri str. H1]EKO59222.1 hypothetical protein LEP1GSC082_1925 [Leptospira kirschneri str. H2]